MANPLLQRPGFARFLLISPATLAIAVFMLAPLGLMAYVSLLERSIHGGVDWQKFSAEAYIRFLFDRNLDDSLTFSTDYLSIFLRSFLLSAVTTATALLVGFPVALYMAMQPKRRRNLLIFLVTIPFWTNLLVRNYAWILLLRDTGLINSWLLDWGVISSPLPLMYNDFAIGVGLTYSFLPFMVLPIYASLEKMDLRLLEAAHDLYAPRWATLRRIVVPLAKPGLIAGAILVFVPCLGSYVTPALLGGNKQLMIGNLIGMQFGASRNWPFGAALAFFLLAVVLLAMTIYALRLKRGEPPR